MAIFACDGAGAKAPIRESLYAALKGRSSTGLCAHSSHSPLTHSLRSPLPEGTGSDCAFIVDNASIGGR
jgi:hypothetical protein